MRYIFPQPSCPARVKASEERYRAGEADRKGII